MRRLLDLTGCRFNRWLVIRLIGTKDNRRIWECQCDCGNIKNIPTSFVYIIKSCGCLQKEKLKEMIQKRGKKPKWPPEHNVWYGIKERCCNPNCEHYPNYGGRGIQICERWLSFDLFLKDMGHRPSKGYSIERINNNGHYEIDNCKWATPKEQANNRRSNRLFNYEGESITMQAIIDKTGINKGTFKSRVYMGWDINRIINTPIKHKKK